MRSSLALVLALTGCAMREGWVKPGLDDQQRKADLYACERDMLIADVGAPFFRRCMESKGYRQQK